MQRPTNRPKCSAPGQPRPRAAAWEIRTWRALAAPSHYNSRPSLSLRFWLRFDFDFDFDFDFFRFVFLDFWFYCAVNCMYSPVRCGAILRMSVEVRGTPKKHGAEEK